MTCLTDPELQVIQALRDADESWLELWLLAKRSCLRSRQATCAIRSLRKRGIVCKRATKGGLSRIEVSLVSGGVW